jgi:NCAIR mutase (PurE)-related protein
MNEKRLKELLRDYKNDRLSAEDFLFELKRLPFNDLGFAKVDNHRQLRCGFPEVIFCQGKEPEQVAAIAREIISRGSSLLATRASQQVFSNLKKVSSAIQYSKLARCAWLRLDSARKPDGYVLIVTAGTSDIPVAEEARITCDVMGSQVKTLYDVGVAGIHRMFSHSKIIMEARVIIAVAGMDAVLPSVLGGLVSVPVIAVPTSVGYGSNFEGLSSLLTMLNSCSPNVCVVNINNGFGAGYNSSLILRKNRKGPNS